MTDFIGKKHDDVQMSPTIDNVKGSEPANDDLTDNDPKDSDGEDMNDHAQDSGKTVQIEQTEHPDEPTEKIEMADGGAQVRDMETSGSQTDEVKAHSISAIPVEPETSAEPDTSIELETDTASTEHWSRNAIPQNAGEEWTAPKVETDAQTEPLRTQPFTQEQTQEQANQGSGQPGQTPQSGPVPLYASASTPDVGPGYAAYQQPRPVIAAKTGPSSGTIIFGTVMLVIGVVVLCMGLWFSTSMVVGITVDVRRVVAVALAAVGVLLLVIAVVYGITSSLRSRSERRREEERYSER